MTRTRITLRPDWLHDLPAWSLHAPGGDALRERARLLGGLSLTIATRKLRAGAGTRFIASFATPPPKGGNVPVGDALALLQILKAHTTSPIRLEGIALPGTKSK